MINFIIITMQSSVDKIVPNNIPTWIYILGALSTFLLGLLGKGKLGELLLKKVETQKECKVKIRKLETALFGMFTVIKTTAQYMNNPENLEQTKKDMQKAIEKVAPIIDEITKEYQDDSK